MRNYGYFLEIIIINYQKTAKKIEDFNKNVYNIAMQFFYVFTHLVIKKKMGHIIFTLEIFRIFIL